MKAFTPLEINSSFIVKNRLVVSAMVTNYCTEDGLATEKYIAYHEAKAKGGWGLIITEDYAISPTAKGFKKLPGLWKDEQIESHKKLTQRVHQAGGKIAAQIYHAGRETTSAVTGMQPVAPSSLKDPTMPEIPHALTQKEITEIVEQFGDCAYRAKQANFDAVEIHGAHGYLVGQFLSPFSNKRNDEYGGTIENRCRFAVEIIENVRNKCGKDFPILFRMSVHEYVPGGLEIEESKAIAQILEKAGIDCIHCSQGVYASTQNIIPPFITPKGHYVNNAAEIKSVVSIPVIAVGRINDIQLAESVLTSDKADLVTMARASLADPKLPKKALERRFDEINHCIGCLQGCSAESSSGNPVRCLVNPITGMEDEYDLTPSKQAKKVLVVGGGVAGCQAALASAIKGHKVTLIEKDAQLGGQWNAAAMPIGKGDFTSLIQWQANQLKKYHVQVLLNTCVDAELVQLYKPDVLIVATGSQPAMPPFKGMDQGFVMSAHDVLYGRRNPGQNVVVVGGGLVGAETADLLAQQEKNVFIIEMQDQIIKDGEKTPGMFLKQRLKEKDVQIHTSSKLQEIKDHAVTFIKNDIEETISNVDTVIIAVGVKTNTTHMNDFEKMDCTVMKVGDANRVKNGYLNIREGFEAGLNI